MYIVTVDGGTTNTRAFLWKDTHLVKQIKSEIGVRNVSIDGDSHKLVETIKQLLYELCNNDMKEDDINFIFVSGMLTSEMGLCPLPHIVAPVALKTLAFSMVKQQIPNISSRPIWFVPGIKNMDTTKRPIRDICHIDMMRGEETEVAGLMSLTNIRGKRLYILPGSHNKYIWVNENDVIEGCMTTLTGEILSSLTRHTILSKTLNRSFAIQFDKSSFLEGVADHKISSLTRSVFLTRVRYMFDEYSNVEAQNYLLGALLADDMIALRKNDAYGPIRERKIIIAAKPVMTQALATIFDFYRWESVIVDVDKFPGISGIGAIRLASILGLTK